MKLDEIRESKFEVTFGWILKFTKARLDNYTVTV